MRVGSLQRHPEIQHILRLGVIAWRKKYLQPVDTRAIWVHDLNSLVRRRKTGDHGLGLRRVGQTAVARLKGPKFRGIPGDDLKMSAEVSIEMEVPAPNPGAMNEALLLSLILPNTVTYRTRQH